MNELHPITVFVAAENGLEWATRVRAVMEAYWPVPFRFTSCGLAPPLSEKANVPLRVPAAVGWNSMLTVQAVFATKSGGHELNEIRKSLALLPVTEMLPICRVVLP